MSKLINEDRFFSDVLKFIGDKEKVVEELIENAARARAENCNINLNDNGIITCHNDGQVLDDFSSLLCVAATGYDEQMVRDQKPAGMGIFMMLAASKQALFKSGNKQLSIDCERFWSESEYRHEIIELLDNQELLKCDDFVDGFYSEFLCDEGFIKTLKDRVFYYTIDMDVISLHGYGFYPLNIVINDVKIQREEHSWHMSEKGTGIFEGCTVGISKNSGSILGNVYWHGKRIVCKDIAPFTIVVDGCTDCISPTLPDRCSISNSADELAVLHTKLEEIFTERLEDFFLQSKGDTRIFNMLWALKGNYNVEHFDNWARVVGSGTYSYMSNFSLDDLKGVYDKDTKLSYNAHDDNLELCAKGSGFERVDLFIGGTKAPQKVLDLYHEKIDVQFKSVDGFISDYIGSSEVTMCESLKIGDVEIDWFTSEGDETFYSDAVNGSEFCSYLWDKDCPDLSLDRYNDDFAEIMNGYNKTVDVSVIRESIRGVLGLCADVDIVNINISRKGVEVEMFDGKRRLLKVA